MHLNTESRHPLKPRKLQSVVSIVGLCLGSFLLAFFSACFPDSIPRALVHTLASQLIFGWSDLGGGACVSFLCCFWFLPNSPLWVHVVLCQRTETSQGGQLPDSLWKGCWWTWTCNSCEVLNSPIGSTYYVLRVCCLLEMGSKHCEEKKKTNLNWVILSQARIS